MSDENGPDDGSGPPEGEEERSEETRRVRPLFRFGRRGSRNGPGPVGEGTGEGAEEEGPQEEEHQDTGSPEEGSRGPVRPVRVVKFIPPGGGAPEEDQVAGAENVEEGEAPFAFEEEAPFAFEEEAPFAVEGGEALFVEEETTLAFEEETTLAFEEEAPFAFEEEEPAPPGGEEATFTEVEVAPDTPYEGMEETRWEEPVHDSLSTQEEAETGGELEFRSEESPSTFEASEVRDQAPETPPAVEGKPHYHKYLKPDEDLIRRPQAKGPATGFDRDMDADAGEIDFGIDLIDPSERKKKKPPRKDKGPAPKKGVGGHDFDGEVDSRGTGAEVGVDYQKRRKRRL